MFVPSFQILGTSIVQPVSNPQPTTADTSDSKGLRLSHEPYHTSNSHRWMRRKTRRLSRGEVDFVDGIGPASTLQKGWILAPGGCLELRQIAVTNVLSVSCSWEDMTYL